MQKRTLRIPVDMFRFQMKFASVTLPLATDDNEASKENALSTCNQQLAMETTDVETGVAVIFSFVTHSTYDSLLSDKPIKPPPPPASPHSPVSPAYSSRPRGSSIEKLLGSPKSIFRRRSVDEGSQQQQRQVPMQEGTSARTGEQEQELVLRYDVHPGSWFTPGRGSADTATPEQQQHNPYPRSEVLAADSEQAFLVLQIVVTRNVYLALEALSATASDSRFQGDVDRIFHKICLTVQQSHGIKCANKYELFRPINAESHWRREIVGCGSEGEMRRLPVLNMPLLTGSTETTSTDSDSVLFESEGSEVNLITSLPYIQENTSTLYPKYGQLLICLP